MGTKWEATKEPSIYHRIGKDGRDRWMYQRRDRNGRIGSETFDTYREAKDAKSAHRQAKRQGTLPDAKLTKKTVEQLFEHFRETSRARPSTLAWYGQTWSKWIAPVLGNRKISEVRRSDLEGFYADVEKKSSTATRRHVQQTVHKLFAVAVRSEWVARNPADFIEMPSAHPHEPRFLTEAEVQAIVKETPDRYRALVWTLAVGGLRIGEATALRVKNLNGTIRVVENAVEVHGKRIVGQPKTEDSERNVPIPETLRKMLREHLTTYGNLSVPESLVFTTEHGKPVGQTSFRTRVFQPAAARAKVTPVPRVHDLRHTAASWMLKRGLSTFEVAKILGHSNTMMVERTYGHLYAAPLQAKVDTLEDVFGT